MRAGFDPANFVRGAVAGAVGGVLGYFAFIWLAHQGLYALILPGTLVGVGWGLASRRRSILAGIVCAAAAVLLGLFCEWRLFPFRADHSFSYFLMHVHLLKPVTLLMIGLAGLFSFWFGLGKEAAPRLWRTPRSPSGPDDD